MVTAEDETNRGQDGQTTARINVCDLLGGNQEVLLIYKNAEYRLRLTSNKKLILTK